jgi:hypothetical protein
MPDIAICVEKVVIPTLGTGILLQAVRLEYPLEYLILQL